MARYVITELEGYMDEARYPGISVQVLDTRRNYSVVGSWRSEDYRPAAGKSSRQQVRQRARLLCDRLNSVPTSHAKVTRTCPDCGGPKSYKAIRCMTCRMAMEAHGTVGGYTNRGCRCAACTGAHTAYQRSWRAR